MSTFNIVEYPSGKTYKGGKQTKQTSTRPKKRSSNYTDDEYIYAIHKIIEMARKEKASKKRKRDVPEYRYDEDQEYSDRNLREKQYSREKRSRRKEEYLSPEADREHRSTDEKYESQYRRKLYRSSDKDKPKQSRMQHNPQFQHQRSYRPGEMMGEQSFQTKKVQNSQVHDRSSQEFRIKHGRIKSQNNHYGGLYSRSQDFRQDDDNSLHKKPSGRYMTGTDQPVDFLPKISNNNNSRQRKVESNYSKDYETLRQKQKQERQKNKNMGKQLQKLKKQLQEKQEEKKRLQNRLIQQMLQGKVLNAIQKHPDPLELETYFQIQRNQQNQKNTQKQKPKNKQKNQIPKIPHMSKTSAFIKNYVPENKEISIQELIRKNNFQIMHEETLAGQPELYFGEIQNDMRHGQGIYINNKMVFEGNWILNQKAKGLEKTENGTYRGTFKNNKRNGEGEFFWPHGEYYSGEWENGKKHGSGYWKSHTGQSYMGQWINGQVSGQGVRNNADGSKYQGEFVDFIKKGRGKEEFPNGDKFEGFYDNGQPQGNGKYFWKQGFTFEGEFRDGFKNGKGKISGKNYQFEGTFVKDNATGLATIKYPNGDLFKGQMSNNKKNGQGVLNNKSQRKIIKGIWRDNKLLSIQKQIQN